MRPFILICILLLGLGLRLDAAWRGADENMPDSAAYERIARGLSGHGEFRQAGPGTPVHPQAATNYSPGLPLLVAGFSELTGSDSPRPARLLLALLSALGIPLAWILAGRLAPPGTRPVAEVVAAAIVAFYPALLADAGMLLTEPLAGTVIAGSLLALLGVREHPTSLWRLALSGTLIGLAALIRPEFLLIGLAAAVALLLAPGYERPRPGAGRAVILPLALVLTLLPWLVISGRMAGHPVPVSSGAGQTLFTGSVLASRGNPQAVMPQLLRRHPGIRADLERQNRSSGEGSLSITPERVLAQLAGHRYPEMPVDLALARLGRENYLRAVRFEPVALAGFLGAKAVRVWWRGRRDVTGSVPGRLVHWLITALAACGLFSLGLRRRPELWPILALALGATAVGALLVASPRRTLALWPVVASLAGIGAGGLFSLVRTRIEVGDRRPVHIA